MGLGQKQVSPVVVVVVIVVLIAVIGLIFKFTLFPTRTIETVDYPRMMTLDDGSVLVAPPGFPGWPPIP